MGRLSGVLFFAVGLWSLCTAYLAATARLNRNGRFGTIRTETTMASEAAWQAAQRASAWSLAVSGSLSVAVGVWLVLAHPTEPRTRTVVVGIAVGIGIVATLIGRVHADRAAKSFRR